MKPKLIVILGPTASGKSALAVDLAREYNGEVVSADSRQVYKGLNIGTGKVTKKEMRGVHHHALDILSPKKVFTVAQFKTLTEKTIDDIIARGKVPILCGGTGFYIQAVVDGIILPDVPPDPTLRKKLQKLSNTALAVLLKKLDPKRAATIDPNNTARLIRAIEIAKALGSVPAIAVNPKYQTLQIGISTDDEILRRKIKMRLSERLKKGMVEEVKKLRDKGLSWKRMHELGLEYRYISLFLQEKISKIEMATRLETEIWHYARRQRAWFKRDTRIKWFSIDQKMAIEKEVVRFLGK
ncbi:MAG TPA: tRNA (adenosine(37)-N6)-dimethylallyltransferase MiaA [Candidatus Paceibacterota bacterium]